MFCLHVLILLPATAEATHSGGLLDIGTVGVLPVGVAFTDSPTGTLQRLRSAQRRKPGRAERVAGVSLRPGDEKAVSNMLTLHFQLLITPPPLTSSAALEARRERRKHFDVRSEGHVVTAHYGERQEITERTSA